MYHGLLDGRARDDRGLAAALAAGRSLASLVAALREGEQRLDAIAADLQQARQDAGALDVALDAAMPEVPGGWKHGEISWPRNPCRPGGMLRTVLRARLVFVALEHDGCESTGEMDVSELSRGWRAYLASQRTDTSCNPKG